MENDLKELLLKDLCARLPYGVKLQHVKNTDSIVELYSIDLDGFYCKIQFYTYKGKSLIASEEGKLLKPGGMLRYKPCLFPMSSMSEEQNHEFLSTCNCYCGYYWTEETFDWLNAHHFDYRGLIPMGLAIDATGLNIY
jgi:hypothetical protein